MEDVLIRGFSGPLNDVLDRPINLSTAAAGDGVSRQHSARLHEQGPVPAFCFQPGTL